MDDLDNLQGMAAAADAGAQALDAPQAEPGTELAVQQGPDYLGEAQGMVDMFAALVTGYAPKTAEVWTEPAKARTAAALAPVMEKYAFSLGAMPPELTLLIVAGPLLWQTSRIVAAQMAEEKAKAKEAEQPERGTVSDAIVRDVQAAPAPEPRRPGQPESAPATPVHPQMALYQK